MNRTTLITGLVMGFVTTSSWADRSATDQNTTVNHELQELRQTVERMQGRIEELEATQGTDWMTAERADEIRSLVSDVLADADSRANLLQGGPIAGHDGNFYLASPDGNFRLNIGGQLQIRFVANNQDMSPVDDDRSGFEMRRLRLLFWGHVFDPSGTYDIQINTNRTGGTLFLEDAALVQKDFGGGWKVKFGQMKAPYMREEWLSSKRMLLVERSLINSMFTVGNVQGVQMVWNNDQFKVAGMFHDGPGSANTAWSVEDTEFALSARGEWLAAGSWGQFNDYSGFRGDDFGVLIGAALHYSQAEFGTGMGLPAPDFNNAEVENFGITIDATIDFDGASIAGVFVYRNLDTDVAGGIDADQIGFFIRGGYFITEEWELFGQYEWADADMAGIKELSVITVGVTRYWDRHNLKWQTDIGFGINEVDPVFASDGAGWRGDSPGQDGQIVLRSQFQLLF